MISNLGLAVEEALRDAKTEGKLEIARKMLLRNIDVNTISDFTGPSIDEIENLEKQVRH